MNSWENVYIFTSKPEYVWWFWKTGVDVLPKHNWDILRNMSKHIILLLFLLLFKQALLPLLGNAILPTVSRRWYDSRYLRSLFNMCYTLLILLTVEEDLRFQKRLQWNWVSALKEWWLAWNVSSAWKMKNICSFSGHRMKYYKM